MTPSQPPDSEARQRIAKLRELLQQPRNKDQVAPLVTALMARDVDIHERMLTDLSKKVQQIEASNNSENTSRLLDRMQNIEQDAKSLRQLITEVDQNTTEAKTGHTQLRAELAKAIDQNRQRIADVERHLKTIGEAMEQRQKTNVEITEILDLMAKNRQRLQNNVKEIRNGLQGMQAETPIAEKTARLIGLVTDYLDQTSFVTGLGSKRSAGEESAGITPACKSSTGTKDCKGSNQDQLQEFPAITEFLAIYDKFIETYKLTRPGNEKDFIESFLNSLNVHVSCAVQRQLLKICPSKVTLATMHAGQQSSSIFVDLSRIDWKTLRRAIPRIKDLRVLQWALNEGSTGPAPNVTLKKGG